MLVGGESIISCTVCHPSLIRRTHAHSSTQTSWHCSISNSSTEGSSLARTTGWRKVMWPTSSPSKGNTYPQGIQEGWEGCSTLPVLSVPSVLDAAVGAAPGRWDFAAQSWDRAEVTDFTSLCNLCWTEADNRTWHLFLLLWPLGTALFCFNFVSTGCSLLSLNHHLSHAIYHNLSYREMMSCAIHREKKPT